MVNRKTRLLNLLALLLVLAVGLPNAQAKKPAPDTVEVNWRFAGAGISNFAQLDDNLDPLDPRLVFHVEAVGSPGSATIVGINQGNPMSVPTADGNLDGCFDTANLKLVPKVLNENSLVATFEDLSVLHVARDGDRLGEDFSCIRFFPFRFQAVVSINFTGGFGRFEGASGEGTITLVAEPVIPGSSLLGEIGTVTGTLVFDGP